jgi:hypothetical protein
MPLAPRALPLALLGFLACASFLPAQQPPEEKPRLIGPRLDEKAKAAALKKYGGTEKTEEAVRSGLDWLARHAEAGGGWKADKFPERCEGEKKCEGIGGGHHGEKVPHSYNDAQTALATMAFLGAGVMPKADGTEQEKLVESSLKKLESPHSAWGMALACEALSEAEAMEGKGRWKASAHRLAQQIVDMRLKEDGCWAYAGGFRGGSDTPYTAFCVQALAASRDAGFEVPKDVPEKLDAFLNSLEEKKGKLAYLKEGRAYGYTPTRVNAHSAAAMRELMAVGTSGARHKLHLACVQGEIPVWKIEWQTVPGYGDKKFQVGNLDVYMWYYGTIASFHAGGSLWTSYFGAVKKELLAKQRKDGCAKGSWNNEGTYDFDVGGRVFTTSLCTLMLEMPYRHVRQRK